MKKKNYTKDLIPILILNLKYSFLVCIIINITLLISENFVAFA